jgi:hypothetical protein
VGHRVAHRDFLPAEIIAESMTTKGALTLP